MYKFIACDMDETLLNDEAKVSQQNKDAISWARNRGVKFVLASGRGFPSMQETAKSLNIDNLTNEYTISFNGSVITENLNNQPLEVNGISFAQMKQLFDFGLNYEVGFHIYTLNDVYMYRVSDEEKFYTKDRLRGFIELDSHHLDFLKQQQIIKILFYNQDRQYLQHIENALEAQFKNQFSISYSANRYLEFNQAGVSKGQALLNLIARLGIKPEQTLAIGDNNNDISMLKAAGLGIAVANATDDAKAAADKVCDKTNNQSAVASIIKHFI